MDDSKTNSLNKIFNTIEENINWTNAWQKTFYDSTKNYFQKFGYITSKQYKYLLKTAKQLGKRRNRAHSFEDYLSTRRKRNKIKVD